MICVRKGSISDAPLTLSAQGRASLARPSSSPASRLAEAAAAFLLERRIAGVTTATTTCYTYQLAPFVAWCERHALDLPDLSVEDIRRYLADRQKVSQNALCEATIRLRTFFRWCATEGLSEDLAARIRHPKREQKVVPALTVGQVRAMLALCTPTAFVGRRDEALIRLLVDTGLRIGEALDLTLERLDLEGGSALVRGKGQKQRVVPIGPRTHKALLRYLPARAKVAIGTDVLFVGTNGRAMNRRHAHQQMKRLAERAGVEGVRVSPHVLRHTCGKMFLQRGGDPFALQALLGHTTLTMTRRYVALANTDVSDAHRKASPGDII